MTQNKDETLELEKDILTGRKFTIADAIGREGGDFLKGESPIPKLQQVRNEINFFITQNLVDSQGALRAVLQTWISSEVNTLARNFDSPLTALEEILTTWIDNEYLLYDLVMQVDRKWGEMNGERPYFQQPGQVPHTDDEYTHESVKKQLIHLQNTIL